MRLNIFFFPASPAAAATAITMAPKKPLTLNEQLALLDDPAPTGSVPASPAPATFSAAQTLTKCTTDFDPEALENEFSDGGGGGLEGSESGASSGEDNGDDGDDGQDASDKARQHYLPVSTSALRVAKRKAEGLAPLGPKYEGARVSREMLCDSGDDEAEEDEGEEDEDDREDEDGGVAIGDIRDGDIRCGIGSGGEDDEIDSDDAFGGSDGERFKGWKFAGSATTEGGVVPKRGDKVAGSSSDEAEEGTDQESSGSDNESQSGGPGTEESEESEEGDGDDDDDEEAETRKALSEIMAEEKRCPTHHTRSRAELGLLTKHCQINLGKHLESGTERCGKGRCGAPAAENV